MIGSSNFHTTLFVLHLPSSQPSRYFVLFSKSQRLFCSGLAIIDYIDPSQSVRPTLHAEIPILLHAYFRRHNILPCRWCFWGRIKLTTCRTLASCALSTPAEIALHSSEAPARAWTPACKLSRRWHCVEDVGQAKTCHIGLHGLQNHKETQSTTFARQDRPH